MTGSGEPFDRCIRMAAGLVRYKLCDRQFECEGCPLDEAFTGTREAHEERRELPDWSFPDDRRYGPAHVWVGLHGANAGLRLGIDALAAALLVGVRAVRLPAPSEELRRDDPLCVVVIAEGEIPLRCPCDGRVTAVNEGLERVPALLVRAPYDAGWVCEMEPSASNESRALISAGAMRRRLGYDLRHFRKRLASYLLAEPEAVGPTLADGGRPLTDLRQILGGASFLLLLRELLS